MKNIQKKQNTENSVEKATDLTNDQLLKIISMYDMAIEEEEKENADAIGERNRQANSILEKDFAIETGKYNRNKFITQNLLMTLYAAGCGLILSGGAAVMFSFLYIYAACRGELGSLITNSDKLRKTPSYNKIYKDELLKYYRISCQGLERLDELTEERKEYSRELKH